MYRRTISCIDGTLEGLVVLLCLYMKEYVQKNYNLYFRYCGGSSCAALPVHEGVCTEEECQENAKLACTKLNPCGHPCGGLAGRNLKMFILMNVFT